MKKKVGRQQRRLRDRNSCFERSHCHYYVLDGFKRDLPSSYRIGSTHSLYFYICNTSTRRNWEDQKKICWKDFGEKATRESEKREKEKKKFFSEKNEKSGDRSLFIHQTTSSELETIKTEIDCFRSKRLDADKKKISRKPFF